MKKHSITSLFLAGVILASMLAACGEPKYTCAWKWNWFGWATDIVSVGEKHPGNPNLVCQANGEFALETTSAPATTGTTAQPTAAAPADNKPTDKQPVDNTTSGGTGAVADKNAEFAGLKTTIPGYAIAQLYDPKTGACNIVKIDKGMELTWSAAGHWWTYSNASQEGFEAEWKKAKEGYNNTQPQCKSDLSANVTKTTK